MWEANHFKLFISHVSLQKDTAHGLKEALKQYQISTFVAHDDIEPTRQWQDEIEEALRSMDVLVALLTPGFHKSKWTDQEVGYAIGSGKLVIPLRLGADPHGFIGKFQGYTIKKDTPYTTIAKDLFQTIARHPTTSRRMAGALTQRFEGACSWASAKSTMGLLEECLVIPEELLKRIEAAEKNNCQISDSWSVPDRIKILSQNHRQIGKA